MFYRYEHYMSISHMALIVAVVQVGFPQMAMPAYIIVYNRFWSRASNLRTSDSFVHSFQLYTSMNVLSMCFELVLQWILRIAASNLHAGDHSANLHRNPHDWPFCLRTLNLHIRTLLSICFEFARRRLIYQRPWSLHASFNRAQVRLFPRCSDSGTSLLSLAH